MKEKWINVLRISLKEIRHNSKNLQLTNEAEFEAELLRLIKHESNDQNDILFKAQTPWYDKDFPPTKPKFYFDVSFFKKSVFELNFNNLTHRPKGYRYEDMSFAIMLKFVKPTFALSSITEDIEKLQVFANETAPEANLHTPVFIFYAIDEKWFEKAKNQVIKTLEKSDENFKNRFIGYGVSPQSYYEF
ncbi:MAG: hypothetical protein H6584_08585 [Flavobacteriales bacterium]|nr:hypothetical protein [Flavobacteriales bacterium]